MDELAHDLGPLRIAEIEAIGHRQRARADRAEVAKRFGDGLLPALVRVGKDVARGAIGGDRQRLFRAVDADHAGIAAGLERVGADLAVVLLGNPATRGERGAGHHLQQVRCDIRALRNLAQRRDLGPGLVFLL